MQNKVIEFQPNVWELIKSTQKKAPLSLNAIVNESVSKTLKAIDNETALAMHNRDVESNKQRLSVFEKPEEPKKTKPTPNPTPSKTKKVEEVDNG